MNCNKVSHLLSAFMDGELLGYEHRLIHQHLQRCRECRTEYEELLQMKRLLAAMPVCEPGRKLAATIVQRVSEDESDSPGINLGDWRVALPGLRGRPLVYSPFVGLGVGITFFGMMFLAHPTSSTGTAGTAHVSLELETADVARDEPPQHVDELTSGLLREAAPPRVSLEPRYSDDLPDFPLTAHQYQSRPMRKSFAPVSYFR